MNENRNLYIQTDKTYTFQEPERICPKHGNVGTHNIHFRGEVFGEANGQYYCLVCYCELIVRECGKLELKP